MSGFEVVGVVLGAVPLLISALEHYSDGIEIIGEMLEYREVVQDLVCSFDTATARFRLTCERLLAPLALPETTLLALLEDPESKAWEEEDLSAQLRKRLGTSYRPYSSSVKRLMKRVNKFAEKLGLDEENGLQVRTIFLASMSVLIMPEASMGQQR